MKRLSSFLASWTLISSAICQDLQINVERPAYDYELIEIVSAGKFDATDREVISEFLAQRQSAMERARGGACLEFADGKISVAEFAVRLDLAIEEMNREIAGDYQTMRAHLSPQGQSTLEGALAKLPLWSADTRAVDIVAIAPGAAETSFTDLCNGIVRARQP